MAKRIQMRKNRFLALQKMAEQKKKEMQDHHDEHHAKQTVRNKTNSVPDFDQVYHNLYFKVVFLFCFIRRCGLRFTTLNRTQKVPER